MIICRFVEVLATNVGFLSKIREIATDSQGQPKIQMASRVTRWGEAKT
jgi:hypothetical protein